MRIVKKPEERRAEMIEAAAKLFVAQGFVRTSVAEIVAAVDVAKGLFYYYFTSKDDMVKAVVEGFGVHLGARMNEIAQSERTGADKLEAVLKNEIWPELARTPFYKDLCMPQYTALYTDAAMRLTEHIAPALSVIVMQALDEAGRGTQYAADMVPVSYTHLDVYKRQVYHHRRGRLQLYLQNVWARGADDAGRTLCGSQAHHRGSRRKGAPHQRDHADALRSASAPPYVARVDGLRADASGADADGCFQHHHV